jgi:Cu(I)/Ag(I) efflux system membrane protein CusA/SilA
VLIIFPTIYAMTGGLLLQWILGYNFSVAVWIGYIALFGIAVETGVVMVVYLHEALEHRLQSGLHISFNARHRSSLSSKAQCNGCVPS